MVLFWNTKKLWLSGHRVSRYSSYKMRRYFSYMFKTKLYGKKFRSEGHFYRTVGEVNSETMKHYVKESQEKYWKKVSFQKKEVVVLQRKINEY